MALNQGNTATPSATTSSTQAAPQAQRPYAQGQSMAFGLSSRISLAAEGEYFNKLHQKLVEKLKPINESANASKISLVKMLKQDCGLNYSCIAVAQSAPGITAVHILIVEKTGEYPTPIYEQGNGVRYEFIRVPGDVMDAKLAAQVSKILAATMSVSANEIVVVDGTLVPQEFSVEDTNDSNIVRLLSNAVSAIDVEVAIRVNHYAGMSIEQIIAQNKAGKFAINMAFNSNDICMTDETGMPVRQDICVTLSHKLPNINNNRSINDTQNVTELVRTFGYIDFDWTYSGVPQVGTQFPAQKFTPNFIITKIEAVNIMPTPDMVLLGVISVMTINQDMNWMQSFKPSPSRKGEIDYNDIGALNVEGNLENSPTNIGKKVNIKGKDFTLTDLNTMVQSLVKPNIMISIDIPKVSPDAWYLSVFDSAAMQTTTGQGAAKRIFNSANHMTNSVFGKLVNGQALSPFTASVNKIHGGYFKTKDGMRDLRLLGSYLSIANYVAETGQQPQLLANYTNSLYNLSVHSDIRATDRKKFLDEMSNGTAVYKQWFTRYTFSTGFLVSFLSSLHTCGFVPTLDNAFAGDLFQRRATFDQSGAVLNNESRLTGMNNTWGNFNYNPGYIRGY